MRILQKIFTYSAALIILVSCQSTPEVKNRTALAGSTQNTSAVNGVSGNILLQKEIDYQSIRRLLGLEKNKTVLGYDERTFNTCQVGFGYSTNDSCLNKYFVVIHFKLMCRDSMGTISTQLSEDDLVPVGNQSLRWTLKNTTGALRTDSEGYGQVMVISAQSQRTERFRVSTDNDFLLMRAGDIKRLVVPSNWCE